MIIKHFKIIFLTFFIVLIFTPLCNGDTVTYPNGYIYENSSFNEISTVLQIADIIDGMTTDGTYLYTVRDDTVAKYWLNNGTLITSDSTTGTRCGISDNFGGVTYYDGWIYATFGKYDSPFRSYVGKIAPNNLTCVELYNTTNNFNAATQAIFNYNDTFYIADAVSSTNDNRTFSKMYSNWTVEKVVYTSDEVGSGWQDAVVVGSKIYTTDHLSGDTNVWVFEIDDTIDTGDELTYLYQLKSELVDDYIEGITYWDGYFYLYAIQRSPYEIIKGTEMLNYLPDWSGMSGTMLQHGDGYLRNPPNRTTNLLAYYSPDTDNSSSGILDDVYGNNDGTIHGATFNESLLDYDGNDYVSTSLMLNTSNDFTIIGRAIVTDKSTQQGYFGSVGNSGTNYRSFIGLRDTKYWMATGETQRYSVTADTITNNILFNFAMTATSGTHKYYVNGNEVDSASYIDTGQQVCGNYIGAMCYNNAPTNHLTGSVGYTAVYNAVLTQDEMNESHNRYYAESAYYQDNIAHDYGVGQVLKHINIAGTDPSANTTLALYVNGSHDNITFNGWELVNGSCNVGDNVTVPISYEYRYFGSPGVKVVSNITYQPETNVIESIILSSDSPSQPPIITDWSNNITQNTLRDITINITESIEFNATADQTVTTWNWYKDNVDQSHNFYNIILSWTTIGSKTVEVNVTNDNGTSNTILWNITVNISSPQNIQTTPSQTWVNITWDAVPNADNYSVYELEDGFPYVNTNPIIDGIKDAIYDYAHEFLIFSPNPVNSGDYETIYPLRTSLGAYFLIESVDNDNKLGDDDTIYYFDLDNDGLTIDDPAWKITNNIVKKYLWDGASWKVTGVSSAVGASTGGGTLYPIHELFIPITELGANWTNGSTVKVLVKRVDSSLTQDVVRWYPYGNINDTNTALWQEMVLNDPESYTFFNNTTNLWYNATGLTPFTIYHGAVSAWNGSQESSYTLFDVITDDVPFYNVSGYIFNQDGNPLPDITVYSCNGFVTEITTTNESGYWIGYAFREGNYTICANHMCYISGSIDIHVTDNMTNQNITLNNVIVNNCELMEKLLEIEDAIDDLSTDFTPTEGNYEMLSSTYNMFLLLLGACLILAFPKRGEVTERDTGLNNVLFSFLGTILAVFLAQIIVSGQVVESFAFESQIYDPLQHYFLYLIAVIMLVVFVLNVVYYVRQRMD